MWDVKMMYDFDRGQETKAVEKLAWKKAGFINLRYLHTCEVLCNLTKGELT